MNRVSALESCLQRLRGANNNICQEAAEIMVSLNEQTHVNPFKVLFQKKYVRCLIIGVGLITFATLGGYPAIIYYAESIFQSAGLSIRLGTVGVAVIQIPSSLAAVGLMDRSGRRPLLMVSIIGLMFGSILGGLSFYLQLFVSMYAVGMGGTVDVILAEIYPMQIKGLVESIIIVVGWSVAWLMTFVFNYVFNWSHSGTFFIFASVSAVTLIFVALIVSETKGLTLEQITAQFN